MSEQEIFLNGQVDLSDLPTLDEVVFTPLQKAYLKVENIVGAIVSLCLFVGVCVVLFQDEIPGWAKILISSLVFSIIGLIFLMINQSFKFKGYAVRERDIIFKKGWIYKKQITVPYIRIQHLDVKQGILERAYDLGKLSIYTAGGQQSDLQIPGLNIEEAKALKSYILGRHMTDEEE